MSNVFAMAGNLTKDAEVRQVGEQSVVKISVADNVRKFKNKEWIEVPLYMDVEYWTKNATYLAELKKGEKVWVSGELTPDSYEKDGKVVNKIFLRANTVNRLSKRDNSGTEDIKEESGTDGVPF